MTEIKNLLAENRGAMQGLHAIANMDFEKPFIILERTGSFTYNSILKDLNNGSALYSYDNRFLCKINTSDYNIFVLFKRTDYSCYQHLYIARLNDSKFETERKSIEGYEQSSGWRWFATAIGKEQFETARKSATGHYFIVAQDKQYKNTRQTTHGNTERYRVYMRDRKHVEAATPYYYNSDKYYDNILDYYDRRTFDKSGYIQQVNNYEQRVKALKAERSAAAAAKYDNTGKLAEFENRIEKLKTIIIENLKSENTNFKLIYNISYNLNWISREMKELKNNSFSSMSAINTTISLINQYITKAEKECL